MKMLIVSGYGSRNDEGFRWMMFGNLVKGAWSFLLAMMQCHLMPTGSMAMRCCVFAMRSEG